MRKTLLVIGIAVVSLFSASIALVYWATAEAPPSASTPGPQVAVERPVSPAASPGAAQATPAPVATASPQPEPAAAPTPTPGRTSDARGGKDAPRVSRLDLSFRLDPRLTRGLHMGDRWVSAPRYSSVQSGSELVVEARALGVVPRGKPVPVGATWKSADPDIVTPSRPEGREVGLEVHRKGSTTLTVSYGSLSTSLAVSVVEHGGKLRVDLARVDPSKPGTRP